MAELDLANALAQQGAGRGGRGRGPAAASAGAKPGGSGWQPLRLGRDFSLGNATEAALKRAAATMNRTLRPEGLTVEVADGSGVASEAQGVVKLPVLVAEARGGKVVRAYDEAEFLSVFARQRQLSGVIVDGQA